MEDYFELIKELEIEADEKKVLNVQLLWRYFFTSLFPRYFIRGYKHHTPSVLLSTSKTVLNLSGQKTNSFPYPKSENKYRSAKAALLIKGLNRPFSVLHNVVQKLSRSEQLCLYSADRDCHFLCNFFVGVFIEITQLHQAAVVGF